MAIGDAFQGYSVDYNIISALGGDAFDDPALALFEDTGFNGCFVKNGDSESWSSETVEWRFDSSVLSTFSIANPKLAYLEFRITWGVEDEGIGGYSVSMSSFLSQDSVNLGTSIQVTNDTATSADAFNRKTAYVRVYGPNIPSSSILKDSTFGIATKFNVYNPLLDTPKVLIYEIKLTAVSSTGGGYVVAYDTDTNTYVNFQGYLDLGTIAYQSLLSKAIRYYNFGDTDIVFTQGGILAPTPFSVKQPSPDTVQQTVTQNSYIELQLGYTGLVASTNYNVTLRYECDAYNTLGGAFYFNLLVSVAAQTAGKISISYNSLPISNSSNLALSSFPKDITNKISILIQNTGTNTLTINSVSLSGDATIAEDSITPNTTLAVNATSYVKFYVSNSSEGNKAATITIISTDTTAPQFIIRVAYNILPQYNVVFKTGASVNDATSEVQDGDTQVFGVVEKGRPLSRSFVLSNSGIYKSVIINSISVNNSNLSLSNLPSLPATLAKNNGNAIVFNIDFSTMNSGLKNGDLTINYSEGS
jgi:hypothetical protein